MDSISRTKYSAGMKIFSMKHPGLTDLLGIYLLAVLVFVGQTFAGDPGLGWHLRTGEWIVTHFAVPRTDPFLFSSDNTPWVYNQWLADVLLWLLYSRTGMAALHAAAVGICVGTYIVILAPLLGRHSSSPLAVFFITFLCALLGKVQWFIRPVLFSFFFAAIVFRVLAGLYAAAEKGENPRLSKSLIILFPAFLLWANLHPAFMIGLGMLGICTLAALFEGFVFSELRQTAFLILARNLLILLVFCFAATLVNPYGLALHKGIFALLGSSYFMHLNREWLPPDLSNMAFLPFESALLLLLVFLLRGGWRRLSSFDFLLTAVCIALSLKQRRYIPFLSIVIALPLLKASAGQVLGNIEHAGKLRQMLARADSGLRSLKTSSTQFGYSVVFWLLLAGYAALSGRLPLRSAAASDFPARYPKQALAAIAAAQGSPGGRIFHHPDWGGYITWVFYPERRAFIDDRNDINAKEKYEECFNTLLALPGWEQTLTKHHIRWALLSPKFALTRAMEKSPSWKLAYQDPPDLPEEEKFVVFERLAPNHD